MKHLLRHFFILAALLAMPFAACVPDDDDDTPPAPICPGEDEVRYVSTDPAMCAVIRYVCEPGEIPYSDPECGCGCEVPECPAESADLTYASHDAEMCTLMRFPCPTGWSHWGSECGCGCARDEGAAEGETCNGIMGIQCAEGLFCAFGADDHCGWSDFTGICTVPPEVCITLYRPVCGCDGRTYSNSCMAASYSVSVQYEGECERTPVQH